MLLIAERDVKVADTNVERTVGLRVLLVLDLAADGLTGRSVLGRIVGREIGRC